MAEYKKAEEIVKNMTKKFDKNYGDTTIKGIRDVFNMCVNCINQTPTADVVEVETIKAWLYEMAINNVGCDGDFSKACEEIISRLDGLRNFAKERSEGDG